MVRLKDIFSIRGIILTLVLTLCFACSKNNNDLNLQKENDPEVTADKEAILFIGNSHTYFNEGVSTHLGRFVENANLDLELLAVDAARGGFTLQDHLADSRTIDKINERSWDKIVLQENTFIAAQELPETLSAMNEFAEMVKQKGTEIYLFMTWPYKDQPEMLGPIERINKQAALETGATLVPVGEDWMAIDMNTEVQVSLYDSDGVHPSLQGTFYAAAKFFRVIYGKPPSDNPYQGGLGPELSDYLKTQAN